MAEPAAPEVPRDPPPVAASPVAVNEGAAAAPPPSPPELLTPEEQMARFERELKEQDWGHQPC